MLKYFTVISGLLFISEPNKQTYFRDSPGGNSKFFDFMSFCYTEK